MLKYNSTCLLIVGMMFVGSAQAEMSAMAFSKDEALHENNISKPRIFILNTGTEPITNFSYRYFFTAEDGRMPVVEDYYTPNETVSLEYLGGNRYAVRYDFYGTVLSGEIYPDENGNVVGIHYPGWEPLCKVNDRSCILSTELVPNGSIEVYAADGYTISASSNNHARERSVVMHDRSRQQSVKVDITVRR